MRASRTTCGRRRVLVAHDFSDYSELALRYALSFAQEYQAELHLLHVLSTPVLTEPELAWGPTGVEGVYQKAALSPKHSVPAEAYAWCEVKTAVRWGRPYREILTYAAEQNIDLISLGARGSELRRLRAPRLERGPRAQAGPVSGARRAPAQAGARRRGVRRREGAGEGGVW